MYIWLRSFLIVILIVVLCGSAVGAKYLIIHPVENEDGTPLEDLGGVIAYCGDDVLAVKMQTVWDGPENCVFRAYDTSGNVSTPWETKVGVKPYPPIVLIYGD